MTTTFAPYDAATGKVREQVPQATAQDIGAAVRAADRAYWDDVGETFGRRCSVNWTV
jgi:acyl-CoA reductase-like NAD-dependent aldehyde dehydrogenase